MSTNNGLLLISEERVRQVVELDWTADHDDGHDYAELAMAAANLAAPVKLYYRAVGTLYNEVKPHWGEMLPREPVDNPTAVHEHFRGIASPDTPVVRMARVRELSKAGALIAAEIDRLMRMGPV